MWIFCLTENSAGARGPAEEGGQPTGHGSGGGRHQYRVR